MNQLIAKKAPKAKHFGGSSSLSHRLAAAVSQKNCGRKYLSQVHDRQDYRQDILQLNTMKKWTKKEKQKNVGNKRKEQKLDV